MLHTSSHASRPIASTEAPRLADVAAQAARLLLEGENATAQALLETSPGASGLVLDTALDIAIGLSRAGDRAGFTRAADRILELLFGADVERLVDVVATLAERALAAGDGATSARLLARAAGPARVLAIRADHARLARLDALAERCPGSA